MLSSNYGLYGDVSSRVMEPLSRYSHEVEIYSIDEAFYTVKDTGPALVGLEREMKAAVRRNCGVPVCVRIAGTKVLAKLSNKWAKNNPGFAGVCHWDSVPIAQRDRLMANMGVGEIWGIAGRLTKGLNALGIHTVLYLKKANPVMIRDRFNVVLMRIVLEFHGTPVFPWRRNAKAGIS